MVVPILPPIELRAASLDTAWQGGGDALQQLYFANRHGVSINDNGGYYQRGKTYGLEVKLFVAAKYLDHKERRGGLRPVLAKALTFQYVTSRRHLGGIDGRIALLEARRIVTPTAEVSRTY